MNEFKFAKENLYKCLFLEPQYFEANQLMGDIFFNEEDRKYLMQKWEIILDGDCYAIKNALTGFYIGQTEIGSIYCGLYSSSPFQRWTFKATTEPEYYVIINAGSGLSLDVIDLSNYLYMNTSCSEEDINSGQMFKIFPLNIEKR